MTSEWWRPERVDPEHRKCVVCRRVFASGHVPRPELYGPRQGQRVCRDCR